MWWAALPQPRAEQRSSKLRRRTGASQSANEGEFGLGELAGDVDQEVDVVGVGAS
jgi:hypothetical protein